MDIKTSLMHKIDSKTKPLGALGKLEQLAAKIGIAQNTLTPQLVNPTILVYAADHGIANEAVSAYPKEVTYQMVANFLRGGAAINVFCRQHRIELTIIDAGVCYDFEPNPQLINAKIARGTQNFLHGPAMSREQLTECFTHATNHIRQIAEKGCNIVGFGEMGIANTSSASMLMSCLCDLPIDKCVGRGTGLNDEQLEHKRKILQQAKQRHGNVTEPRQVLQTFGGFEIAQMCGAMLAAFERKMLIMVDGFIATSSFLVASKIEPRVTDYAIFCHQSDEAGHGLMLQQLHAEPILSMSLRLGEGTGAALAYPLIQSAVCFLHEMASFESANVSDKESRVE